MNSFGRYILVLLVGLACHWGYGQSYNFTHYTVEEGLAQNQILSLYQDHDGYLWFGTNLGGVSVFDGVKFQTINETNGLPSNVVFSICEGGAGEKYFATNGGLGVLQDREFTNFSVQEGLAHERVFKVLQDSKGRIWLGTQQGVYEFKEGKIAPFSLDSTLSKISTYQIYEDSKGSLWFCTIQNGVYKFDGEELVNYSSKDGLLHNFVKTIIEDDNGNYWIGTLRGFNILSKDGKITEKRIKENETLITINSSAKDKDGVLWFGTESGLVKYIDGEFKKFDTKSGLSSMKVWTILVDDESNLWLGSNGKGVSKFNYHAELFYNYSIDHGLSNDIVTAIYEANNGSMWIGSDGSITRFEKGKFEKFTYLENNIELSKAGEARAILQSKDGKLYMATRSSGLYVYDDGNFEDIRTEDGLLTNKCYSIMQDKNGLIWLGTKEGVQVIDFKGKIDTITELKGKGVWSIFQDSKSQMWFTSDEGACMYDGSSYQYFNEKDNFVTDRVRNVVEDKQGNLWFATNNGVYRYDPSKAVFTNLSESSGLISNTIYSILMSRSGLLWLGTQKGIQRIDVEEYNKTGNLISKAYSKSEGFIGVECNSNAIYEDSKGRIWFGTVQGVTVFDPSLETKNTKEPSTHVTNLRLEFEDYDWSEFSNGMLNGLPVDLVLPYKKNHLSFDFVGISYSSPEKVKYQFMLSPLDDYWLNWTSKNEAVYPHIPPGKYTFMVKAKNNDGVVNSEPTEFSFVILPPWYKTWWFYTISFVSIVSLIYGVFAWRTRQLKIQKEILEQQVADRTKELREEKEKVEKINEEVLEKNAIIEEKNHEIMDSINYAKGIQEAILPDPKKVAKYLPESFILFRPKDIVSGDFYWMDHVDGITYFTAADCTGHGVPGAFVSMVGANGLNRALGGFHLRKPGEILDKLTDLVEETFKKRKDGMDIALCALDHDKFELQFSGANNPLWIVRSPGKNLIADGVELEPNIELEQNLFEIKADKQPVGSFDHRTPFTTHTVKLEKGDTIYVFSDGYPDQFGGVKGKKFMSKSLKKLLISVHEKSMEEQRLELNANIEDWMNMGNIEQIDDICIFGVRV